MIHSAKNLSTSSKSWRTNGSATPSSRAKVFSASWLLHAVEPRPLPLRLIPGDRLISLDASERSSFRITEICFLLVAEGLVSRASTDLWQALSARYPLEQDQEHGLCLPRWIHSWIIQDVFARRNASTSVMSTLSKPVRRSNGSH